MMHNSCGLPALGRMLSKCRPNAPGQAFELLQNCLGLLLATPDWPHAAPKHYSGVLLNRSRRAPIVLPTALDALDCSQQNGLLPTAPNNTRLLRAAHRCSRLIPTLPGPSVLLPAAAGCSRLLPAAPGCPWLLPAAPGCSRLLPATPRCSGLLPVAPGRIPLTAGKFPARRWPPFFKWPPGCSELLPTAPDGPLLAPTAREVLHRLSRSASQVFSKCFQSGPD